MAGMKRAGAGAGGGAAADAAAAGSFALFGEVMAVMSPAQVAARIGLHVNTVSRWMEVGGAPAHYRMDFLRLLGRPLTPVLARDAELARRLDLFFTRPQTARYCWEVFGRVTAGLEMDLRRHLFVEPAAGEGAFLDVLPRRRRVGLDVLPRRGDVVEADFLTWAPPRADECRAVVGNPPFGLRGHAALQFVNRAAGFADVVAFILPQLFESDGKGAPMKRVDARLALAHSERLPPDSFVYPDGAPACVNTVFQVWVRGKVARRPAPTCDAFVRVYSLSDGGTPASTRNRAMIGRCDVYLPSTCYAGMRAYESFAELPNARGYGVAILQNKREIRELLMRHEWRQTAFPSTNSALNLRSGLIRRVVVEGGFCDE